MASLSRRSRASRVASCSFRREAWIELLAHWAGDIRVDVRNARGPSGVRRNSTCLRSCEVLADVFLAFVGEDGDDVHKLRTRGAKLSRGQ
jgi:hypothetical protein